MNGILRKLALAPPEGEKPPKGNSLKERAREERGRKAVVASKVLRMATGRHTAIAIIATMTDAPDSKRMAPASTLQVEIVGAFN